LLAASQEDKTLGATSGKFGDEYERTTVQCDCMAHYHGLWVQQLAVRQ